MFGLRRGLLGSPMGGAYGQDFQQGASGQMSGAGMDAMGSLKEFGDYGKRFQSNPTGGMTTGLPGFMSGGFGSTGGMNYGGY